jgi:hypothetical protein
MLALVETPLADLAGMPKAKDIQYASQTGQVGVRDTDADAQSTAQGRQQAQGGQWR